MTLTPESKHCLVALVDDEQGTLYLLLILEKTNQPKNLIYRYIRGGGGVAAKQLNLSMLTALLLVASYTTSPQPKADAYAKKQLSGRFVADLLLVVVIS